ncbi:MAG: hypothetical protein QXU69_07270 [Thermofilaceae archaeon]
MSEDRIRYLEKIGEIVQKIVNPPQRSERAQQLIEGLEILREMNNLAKEIAMQDMALKGLAAAIEDLQEKHKALTVMVVLSYALLALLGLLLLLTK